MQYLEYAYFKEVSVYLDSSLAEHHTLWDNYSFKKDLNWERNLALALQAEKITCAQDLG